MRHQRGFSLLELAVVLGVAGLLAAAAIATSGGRALKDDFTELALQQRLAQTVIAFAQRNHRLPCPDSTGDGLENCDGGVSLGGVPFVTLEVAVAGGVGSALARSYMYGVYRAAESTASADADLAQLRERTGNQTGELGYLARNDLVMALRNAHRRAADPTRVRVAGPGGGASSCAGTATNVAFVLVYAGKADADRATPASDYDGANGALKWPAGSTSKCVESPALARSERYDDTVVSVSFTELLGYLLR